MPFNSYADVQAGLSAFVKAAGVSIALAPHHAFWENMSYKDFTTGNVPGPIPGGPWPILVVGDSKNSNIVQILSGVGNAADNFGQMPQPDPPYIPPAGAEQAALITNLAAWIDAGCPNTST